MQLEKTQSIAGLAGLGLRLSLGVPANPACPDFEEAAKAVLGTFAIEADEDDGIDECRIVVSPGGAILEVDLSREGVFIAVAAGHRFVETLGRLGSRFSWDLSIDAEAPWMALGELAVLLNENAALRGSDCYASLCDRLRHYLFLFIGAHGSVGEFTNLDFARFYDANVPTFANHTIVEEDCDEDHLHFRLTGMDACDLTERYVERLLDRVEVMIGADEEAREAAFRGFAQSVATTDTILRALVPEIGVEERKASAVDGELTFSIGGVQIADAAFGPDSSLYGPGRVCLDPEFDLMMVSNTMPLDPYAVAGVCAMRLAEMRLCGGAFRLEPPVWEEAVSAIAGVLVENEGSTMRWTGCLPMASGILLD